ncbi:MAG: hypothetical protein ABIL68_04225, partial [bacterium]
MKINNAFIEGFRIVRRNKRMAFIVFLIQLAFALVLVLPLRTQWNHMLGQSLIGQEVLQGEGANVFFEFIV